MSSKWSERAYEDCRKINDLEDPTKTPYNISDIKDPFEIALGSVIWEFSINVEESVKLKAHHIYWLVQWSQKIIQCLGRMSHLLKEGEVTTGSVIYKISPRSWNDQWSPRFVELLVRWLISKVLSRSCFEEWCQRLVQEFGMIIDLEDRSKVLRAWVIHYWSCLDKWSPRSVNAMGRINDLEGTLNILLERVIGKTSK